LLTAVIDVGELIVPRIAHDIAGHYQRHDLFSLTLDQRPQPPIRLVTDDFALRPAQNWGQPPVTP
jgi:nitrilase